MAEPQLDYIVTAGSLGHGYHDTFATKIEAIERAKALSGAAYERRRIFPAQEGPVFEYEGGVEAPTEELLGNGLTVLQAREKRDALQKDMAELALRFERETGMAISGVNLFRSAEYVFAEPDRLVLKSIITLDWEGKMKIAEGVAKGGKP